ncbi:MAG: HIT family protein [Pseudomonadota bacterium]
MSDWFQLKRGEACPFDLPGRSVDSHMLEVRKLRVSTLYLSRIQTYRGHCVLLFDPRHATRIDELSAAEWAAQAQDIFDTDAALLRAFEPDHINIASIGQLMPHLHWHIVPRYRDDPRWGGPIWMTRQDEMSVVHLSEAEYGEQIAAIRAELPG